MTKTINKLALATTALAALGLGATGASAAPASANAVAKAKVLAQLTIKKTTDLDFGTIVAAANASTVAVDAAGAITCGTGVTCTGTGTAAKFAITGTNNAVVNVTMPNSVTLANGTGGSMIATLVKVSTLNLGDTGKTGTPLAFGASLAVGAAQADGLYSSPEFAVTVDYQ